MTHDQDDLRYHNNAGWSEAQQDDLVDHAESLVIEAQNLLEALQTELYLTDRTVAIKSWFALEVQLMRKLLIAKYRHRKIICRQSPSPVVQSQSSQYTSPRDGKQTTRPIY